MYVLRHYLALLIATAAPLAILSVPVGAVLGTTAGAGIGVLATLAFGGLMALVLGTLSIWRQHNKGLSLSEPLGPRQQARVVAPPAMSKLVQDAELKALLEDAGYKPTRNHPRNECLTARTPTTLLSFGIKINACTDGRIATLVTKPALATTVTDYGEARLMLLRLTRQLQDRWNSSPTPSQLQDE